MALDGVDELLPATEGGLIVALAVTSQLPWSSNSVAWWTHQCKERRRDATWAFGKVRQRRHGRDISHVPRYWYVWSATLLSGSADICGDLIAVFTASPLPNPILFRVAVLVDCTASRDLAQYTPNPQLPAHKPAWEFIQSIRSFGFIDCTERAAAAAS